MKPFFTPIIVKTSISCLNIIISLIQLIFSNDNTKMMLKVFSSWKGKEIWSEFFYFAILFTMTNKEQNTWNKILNPS